MTLCKFVSSSNDNSIFDMLRLKYALISLSFEGENFVSTSTLLCKNKFLSIKGDRDDST